MSIPTFLQGLLTRIIGKFSAAAHAALEAIQNLKITDEIQQVAHDAVLAAEQAGGTGADKFNAALAIVRSKLVDIGTGVAMTAVQNAWGALFGK